MALNTTGDIVAKNYIVSSSVTNMTQSFSSGSTIFGDSSGDTHVMTGSLFVTGDTKLGSSAAIPTHLATQHYNLLGQAGQYIFSANTSTHDIAIATNIYQDTSGNFEYALTGYPGAVYKNRYGAHEFFVSNGNGTAGADATLVSGLKITNAGVSEFGGDILANNSGDAGSPAYSFTGDTDTGFFREGADTIGISTGGARRWSITTGYITSQTSGASRITDGAGSAAAPSFTFNDDGDTGMFRLGANRLAFATQGVTRLILNDTSNGGSVTFAGALNVPEYIYHDSQTTTYIRFESHQITLGENGGWSGSGSNLSVSNGDIYAQSSGYIYAWGAGKINLRNKVANSAWTGFDIAHDGSNGLSITRKSYNSNGDVVALSIDSDAQVHIPDSQYLYLGAGNDLGLLHNGSHSYITNATGNFYLKQNAAGQSIIFHTRFGGGSSAAVFEVTDGGVSVSSGTLTIGSEVLNTNFSSSLSGRVASLQAASSGISISNNTNDRVLTGDGTNAVAEAGLLFNGTNLGIATDYTTTAKLTIKEEGTGIGVLTDSAMNIHNTTTNNTYSQITFGYDNGRTYAPVSIAYHNQSSTAYGIGSIIFSTRNSTSDSQPSERMRVQFDGKVGIGTSASDTNLHIHKASAGTVASDANAQLTIENNDHASLQFLTPNNKQQQILFGDPDDIDIGYINYNHNTNKLAFAVAAGIRMTIASGGQVGIGVDAPTAKLEIYGDGGVQNQLRLRHDGSGTNGVLDLSATSTNANIVANYSSAAIPLRFFTGGAERMRISATGNVGIGTTNPGTKLEVVGGNWNTSLAIKGGAATSGIMFKDSDNNVDGYIYAASDAIGIMDKGGDFMIQTVNDDSIKFSVGASEKMRILNSGNVGIGTDTPTSSYEKTLHLHDSSGNTAIKLTTSATGTTVNDGTDLLVYGSDFYLWQREAGKIFIGTSAATRMMIDATGNVGINTTTPGSKLEILQGVGNGSSYDVIKIDGDTGNYGGMWMAGEWAAGQQGRIGFYATSVSNKGVGLIGGAGTTPHLFVNASGNVGIGTTNPVNKLHVANSMLIENDTDINGSEAILYFKVDSQDTAARRKAAIVFQRVNSTGVGNLHFAVDSTVDAGDATAVNDTKFFISGSGKIGIGTTDPVDMVTIRGGGAATPYPSLAGYTGTTKLYALEQHFGLEGRLALYDTGNLKVLFRASGSSYINTGSTLKFGIGTASPSHKLDVSGTLRATGDATFGAAVSVGSLTVNGGQVLTPSGINLALNPNTGVVSMGGTFQTTGVGNSTMAGNLIVAGNITAQQFITEYTTDTVIATSGSTSFGNASTNKHRFTGSMHYNLDADSAFSIVTGGTNAVHLKAGAGDEIYFGSNNSWQLRMTTGGSAVYLNSGVSLLPSTDSSSDIGSLSLRYNNIFTDALNSTGQITSTGEIYGTAGFRSDQSSTTAFALRLSDTGVANYDFTFPDTSTMQLGVDTSSTKQLKLINAGSGVFNLNVEGNISANGHLTLTPHDELRVAGNSTNFLKLYDSAGAVTLSSGGSGMDYPIYFNQYNVQAMIVKGKNVGIGTQITAPYQQLVVNGGETSTMFNRTGASGGDHNIMMNTDQVLNNRNQILFNAVTNGYNDGGGGESSTNTFAMISTKVTQAHSSALKGEMAFKVNTGDTISTVMTLSDSNRVGIGTESPTSKLEIAFSRSTTLPITYDVTDAQSAAPYADELVIKNTANNEAGSFASIFFYAGQQSATPSLAGTGRITLRKSSASSYLSEMGFWTRRSDGDMVQRMFIDEDGNTGIGCSATSYKLQVNGRGMFFATNQDAGWGMLTLDYGNGSNTSIKAIQMKEGGSTKAAYGYGNNGDLVLYPNNTEQVRILANGNVGIGATSPVGKLDVVGTQTLHLTHTTADDTNKNAVITSYQYDSGTETEGFMMMQSFSNSSTNRIDLGGGNSGHNAVEEIRFHTAANHTTRTGTQRMVIDASGNVGIGSTAPAQALDVVGGGAFTTSVFFNGRVRINHDGQVHWGASYNQGYLSWNTNEAIIGGLASNALRLQSGGATTMFMDTSQNVGIGTVSPSAKLEINTPDSTAAMRFGSDSHAWLLFTKGQQDHGGVIYLQKENGSVNTSFNASPSFPSYINVLGGNLGVGTSSPDYQLELEKAGGGFLSFKTTDTDLQNNDVLGTIQFAADDATASGIDIGAKIVATVTDNFQSAGSNVDAPTRLDFFTQDNTTTDVMSTVGATLTLGGDDQSAIFRGNVEITSTDTSSSENPVLSLFRNSASPAIGDKLGKIQFKGEDSIGNSETYSDIYGFIDEVTHTIEGGGIHFRTMKSGTLAEILTLKRDAVIIGHTYDATADGKLHIAGINGVGIALNNASSGNNNMIRFQNGGQDRWDVGQNGSGDLSVYAYESGTTVMGIDGGTNVTTFSGQVVINHNDGLDVNAGAATLTISQTSGASMLYSGYGVSTATSQTVVNNATKISFQTNNSERLEITSAGYSNFKGWIQGNGQFALYSSTGDGTILQAPTTTEKIFFRDKDGVIGMTYDADNKKLRVGDTSAPGYDLEVAGTFLATGDILSYEQIYAGNGTDGTPSYAMANDPDTGWRSDLSNNMRFITGGTVKMVLNSSGNVGIGTDNPDTDFHLERSGNVTMQVEAGGSNQTSLILRSGGLRTNTDTSRIWFQGGSNTQALIEAQSGGSSAIGSLGFHTNDGSSLTEEMRLTSTGTLHVDADVIAYSSTVSDKILKDDVVEIKNPLEKVQKLRGVEYTWNAGSRKGKRDLGVIAQETEKVIPEIVHEHEMPLLDDSGKKYKTVDYEKLTALLIESVKEQQKQIDELKSEIKELKDGSSK